METQTQHTPTPWTYRTSGGGVNLDLDGADGTHVADVIFSNPDGAQTPWNRANGEFIVLACNCHDGLVAALKKATSAIIVAQAHGFDCCGLLEEVEAALAKASA